jgi:hypothetical protein
MPDTTSREERLAEVTRLSRKPMQQLHANLLDVVLTAMNGLSADDWAALAKKAPDRIIQGLAMTAKMAGYGDKLEHELHGGLELHERINAAPDSEIHAWLAAEYQKIAPGVWAKMVAELPTPVAEQVRALPEDVVEKVRRIMVRNFAGPVDFDIRYPES